MHRILAIFAIATAVGCSSTPPPDLRFQMDAFRTPPTSEVGWVAWTKRGLEVDGEVLADAGEGCLPEKGWPNVILWMPGESEFWLYGTEPKMSGDAFGHAGDAITFDCVVGLDGATRTGLSVSVRVDEKPVPSDNFGTLPAPWRQQRQSSEVDLVTPNGVVAWRLSESRRSCWLAGHAEGAYSACLPTSESPGLEVKRWIVTPVGIVENAKHKMELPEILAGDGQVWINGDGQLVVVALTRGGETSRIWVRATPQPIPYDWSAEGLEIRGTVTSAVFDGKRLWVLATDFDEQTYRLFAVDGSQARAMKIPKHARPTTLHLSSDGTLWGSGYDAAWILREPATK